MEIFEGNRIQGIIVQNKFAIINVYGPANVGDENEINRFYNFLYSFFVVARD